MSTAGSNLNSRYVELAKKWGTPLYVYDLAGLRARAKFFKKHIPEKGHAFFAMKANNNRHVLAILREEGYGIDAVSMGEMQLALECGFRADQIVFSGVGKTVCEIEFAIDKQIQQINVESAPELERIIGCARRWHAATTAREGRSAYRVPVALRMNPDVGVNTHPYIQTGFRENKFGLDFTEVSELTALLKKNADVLELRGLTLHIGSQIREVESFSAAIKKNLDLFTSLRAQGFALSTFDVGGGLGMNYESPDFAADEALIVKYMAVVQELLGSAPVPQIFFEPGRVLVARFGALLTEVQYVKRTPYKNFLIVDAGMHELMRPSLYQAFHRIEVVKSEGLAAKPSSGSLGTSSAQTASFGHDVYDVVGPICESADTLGRDRYLPNSLKAGDYLAVYDVGAYGAVMASHYNLREPAKQVTIGERDE